MGQLASCVTGAIAGCCCREIERAVEQQVRTALRQEMSLLREELASCYPSSCATRCSGADKGACR